VCGDWFLDGCCGEILSSRLYCCAMVVRGVKLVRPSQNLSSFICLKLNDDLVRCNYSFLSGRLILAIVDC
jgi:hypothetical protein